MILDLRLNVSSRPLLNNERYKYSSDVTTIWECAIISTLLFGTTHYRILTLMMRFLSYIRSHLYYVIYIGKKNI